MALTSLLSGFFRISLPRVSYLGDQFSHKQGSLSIREDSPLNNNLYYKICSQLLTPHIICLHAVPTYAQAFHVAC